MDQVEQRKLPRFAGRILFEGRLQYCDYQLHVDGLAIEDRDTAIELASDLAFALTRLQRFAGQTINTGGYTVTIRPVEKPSGRIHDYTGD